MRHLYLFVVIQDSQWLSKVETALKASEDVHVSDVILEVEIQSLVVVLKLGNQHLGLVQLPLLKTVRKKLLRCKIFIGQNLKITIANLWHRFRVFVVKV